MENFNQRQSYRNQSVNSGKVNVSVDIPFENFRNAPSLTRKISKRREVQDQRSVVLDLFKELIGKFNQGYSKVLVNSTKNINYKMTPITKLSKKQSKFKPRQTNTKQSKDQKPRKNSQQEQKLFSSKKQQLWQNYQQLMTYQIMDEEEIKSQQNKSQ